jgi:hypothetical protein
MTTTAVPSGLLRYSPEIEDDIIRFQREVFAYRRQDWVVPRWRWMFVESAERLAVAPMVWVYRRPEGVVGHQGAIPVRVKVGESQHVSGWFVETAVLDSVRGKAIGPMVVAKALQDLPFNLSLGQTPEMRAIQFRLGWTEVCPLRTCVFVLRANPVLRTRVRQPLLRHAAAAALATAQAARHWWGRRRGRGRFEVRAIERFDETHTTLWRQVARQYPCAVVRDASYLNWKYTTQPGQQFTRLEIRRDGALAGLVVVTVREPSPGRPYRRGFIVDAVLPPRDADVVHAAYDAARRALLERGADLMVLEIANDDLVRHARAFGFMANTPERVFLVATGGLPPEQAALVRAPENWLITGGDSDIDRPW